ncbi:MAG TPA: choice-of-anchor D domain-containing protein [Bryocella sp.]|nr:choice-of-anchor D domain-containing protein [Bryocella sp.]
MYALRISARIRACVALLVVPMFFAAFAGAQTGLVISQVYGGGGNTGAPYSNDFIELYNPTSSPISLNGLSVQYGSATTTSTWSGVTVLPASATVAPGHYFLIQEAEGTTVTNKPLPAADATGSVNLSGTAGKVALVNGTTAVSGCPTGATILDLVGFGTTANCFEGSGATPAPSNTTSVSRDSKNDDTNNNAADFTTGAPNPRNSSFGSTGVLSATGAANPATVSSGDTTLLTVTVTPGTGSTGIAVTADLSSIGGSATQAFYDDASHGDATGNDNVFSFLTTATSSSATTYSLPVNVTDTESGAATTTISLRVNPPAPDLPIHTIQGEKSLTGATISPYAGQTVKTEGIVTGVGTSGYFIQTPDASADNDPLTPEGVEVFTGSGKVPAQAVIGNYVQVTGTVATFPAASASHTPATEIDTTSATVLATGQALPAPITLTTSMLTPSGGLYQLTPYEGMRVSIPSMTSISGTDGNLSEKTETETSNGEFYAVISGTPRPFREPGIDIRDPQTGLPPNAAKFDDNPERILVDSSLFGGSAIDLSTNAVLTNVTGVLDFTFSSDSFYDPSRLILDKTYNRANVTPGTGPTPVAAPAPNEFRVAAYNVERFFNPSSADDVDFNPVTGKTENSQAVDVTPAAYANRLAKLSLAVRHILGNPDVIGLEEPENQSVVADMAQQISNDAIAAGEEDPKYVAYGTGTDYAPYTNDIGGISVGFLVKSTTVDTISIEQKGATDTFADPRNPNTQQTLNDRPPLVLHAGIKRANGTDYPVTVIVNHLRSLSSENDPSSGIFVRDKKELQAEFLANMIQGYQSAGEHVVSVGDYNAFEFSDGYIDILATVTNRNVLPADQVVQPGKAGLVDPPTTDLVTLLPADQRWSYQEFGNAQVLDHIVATSDLVAAGAHMAYAHFDADQPLVASNDPTTPARESDHDAAVGYFTLPAPVLSATLTGNGTFGKVPVGSSSDGSVFVLTNNGEGQIVISNIATTGDFSETPDCGATLDAGDTCNINVVFKPSASGTRTGTLTVTTNTSAGTYTANLSGTGGAMNVTSAVSTKASGLIYNRIAKTGTETITVTNTSGAAIAGPLDLVLAINNANVKATNATGTFQGNPYWASGNSLAPGASVTFSVTFSYPLGTSFTTTPTLYSGGF